LNLLKTLGFDEDFDATAQATRAKASTRLGITVALMLVSLPLLGLRTTLVWAATAFAAEAWLWNSTAPAAYRTRPVRARTQRVLASLVATVAWVVLGVAYWRSGGESLRLTALALLSGVILYSQKACDKTPIHMLITAVPPAAAVVILPLTLALDLAHMVGIEVGMLLLVVFGASSAVASYADMRKLKRTTAELVAQREAAHAANRAKTEFLANMSHEIRTPLNGVVGLTDVLSRTRLDGRQREIVEVIGGSARSLERLLSDLLDLARVEAGGVSIESRPFRLGEAARAVAALFEMQASEKGVALEVTIAPEAEAAVLGDEVRVKQVIGNLLSNAVKFTDRGRVALAVDAGLHAGRPAFRIQVEDTGVGFDGEQKARIFGRFQQADGSIARRFGGAGLGLAISRRLVELFGGELDCASTPGTGSVFTAWLPLPVVPAADSPTAGAAPGSAVTRGVLRVLLADDHAVNRKVVELMMGAAGAELTSVEDGQAACAAFQVGAFDVVLMDMQMPVMDGLAAVRRIRALEAAEGRTRTPVLMLTANALPEHARAAADAGADGHLAKPVTSAALLEAVARVLEVGTPDARAPLAAG
jgi:signal transduction histidine kinase/ActR/RegA family two-component response regulator